MILCPNCGQQNRDGFRFCQSCGTPLSEPQTQPQVQSAREDQTCFKCGTTNPPGMRFCKACGAQLSSDQPDPQPPPATETPAAQPPPTTETPAVQHPPAAETPAAQQQAADAQPAAAAPAKEQTCPNCGAHTPGGYRFCQQCGTPLAATTPPPGMSAAATQPRVSGEQAAQVADAAAAAENARTVIDPASQATPVDPAAAATPAHTGPQAPAAGPAPDVAATIISPASGGPAAAEVALAGSAVHPGETVGPATASGASEPEEAAAEEAVPAQTTLARLVSVQRDGSDGDVHEISEESFDLGRTEGQLTFVDDPYLSDRHCRFFIRDGKWMIQDLESENGAFLRLRTPRTLHAGDRLLLGKQVLCFDEVDEDEAEISPAVQHGVMIFGSPVRRPWGRLRQLTVAGIYRDVYHLYRDQVVIGREDGDLTFPDDEFMSRKHMAASRLEGDDGEMEIKVQDLGSSNGTYMLLSGTTESEVGDMLRVGDQLLRFETA